MKVNLPWKRDSSEFFVVLSVSIFLIWHFIRYNISTLTSINCKFNLNFFLLVFNSALMVIWCAIAVFLICWLTQRSKMKMQRALNVDAKLKEKLVLETWQLRKQFQSCQFSVAIATNKCLDLLFRTMKNISALRGLSMFYRIGLKH